MFLVRHGETSWNAERRVQGQSESKLNDTGRQQAQSLRTWAESAGFDAIYSSSSVRTVETAEIITENIDLPLQKRDDLREIHLGPWEQLLWSDIEQSGTQQVVNFREFPHLFNLEGAETFSELRDRGINGLHQIAHRHDPGDKILVVSHGALLAVAMSGLASVCLSRLWKNPSLPNCSVSEVIVDKARDAAVDRGAEPIKNFQVVSVAGTPLHDSPWFEIS